MNRGWGGTLFDEPQRAVPCAHGRYAGERCPFCTPSTAETRHEAEESIKPSADACRQKVYECIVANPQGVHDEKIAELTGLLPNTARPRRLELERAGRIVAAGSAKTRSGRKAVTWVVA